MTAKIPGTNDRRVKRPGLKPTSHIGNNLVVLVRGWRVGKAQPLSFAQSRDHFGSRVGRAIKCRKPDLLGFIILTILGSSLLLGCEFDQKVDLADQERASYQKDGLLVNKNLRLLTPEQFIAHISQALLYNDQNQLEQMLERYGVALGGVDFRVASHRNRIPSGQSQLAIRRLAWDVASAVVDRDLELQQDGAAALTFDKVRISVDRPTVDEDYLLPPEFIIAIEDGQNRFEDQLHKLYWLILSRPPTSTELSLMATTFTQVVTREQSAKVGWQVILYMLLASMEYWNI